MHQKTPVERIRARIVESAAIAATQAVLCMYATANAHTIDDIDDAAQIIEDIRRLADRPAPAKVSGPVFIPLYYPQPLSDAQKPAGFLGFGDDNGEDDAEDDWQADYMETWAHGLDESSEAAHSVAGV